MASKHSGFSINGQHGSVLLLVLVALMIVGMLLARMSEQAVLDDCLTHNFIHTYNSGCPGFGAGIGKKIPLVHTNSNSKAA